MAMSMFNSFMQKLEQKLNEKSKLSPLLEKAEKTTGLSRGHLALGSLGVLALYLIFGYGAQLICNCIGFFYPAYCSIHALESPDKNDDTKWLTYWVVFAAFSVMEFFSDMVLSWFPFYWLAKCAFLIYCFAPIGSNGSQVIYKRIIRPIFLKNHQTVDKAFSKAKEVVTDTVEDVAKFALDSKSK